MRDYKIYIFPLLKGKKLKEKDFEEFKNSIKKIIKDVFKQKFTYKNEFLFKKAYGETYLDELFQEFIVRIFQNKETILKCNFIDRNYLFSMIQNMICRHLSSNLKLLKNQINFEDLGFLYEEQEKVKVIEKLAPQAFDYLKEIRIIHWLNELKRRLDEKDEETLCYYLYKILYKKEMVLKNLNKTLLYKRWERLKVKLRNILGNIIENEEIEKSKEFFERYVSEICQKKYYIKKKQSKT